MLKLSQFTLALVVASLASPAFAGPSWPNVPSSKGTFAAPLSQNRAFRNEENDRATFASSVATASAATRASADSNRRPDAFAYGAEETGWQLTQHKYVLAAGKFAHSQECDHAIRTVKAPVPAEVEAARGASPG